MSAVREVADYIERYFQDEYGMTLAELKQLAELKRDGKLIYASEHYLTNQINS